MVRKWLVAVFGLLWTSWCDQPTSFKTLVQERLEGYRWRVLGIIQRRGSVSKWQPTRVSLTQSGRVSQRGVRPMWPPRLVFSMKSSYKNRPRLVRETTRCGVCLLRRDRGHKPAERLASNSSHATGHFDVIWLVLGREPVQPCIGCLWKVLDRGRCLRVSCQSLTLVAEFVAKRSSPGTLRIAVRLASRTAARSHVVSAALAWSAGRGEVATTVAKFCNMTYTVNPIRLRCWLHTHCWLNTRERGTTGHTSTMKTRWMHSVRYKICPNLHGHQTERVVEAWKCPQSSDVHRARVRPLTSSVERKTIADDKSQVMASQIFHVLLVALSFLSLGIERTFGRSTPLILLQLLEIVVFQNSPRVGAFLKLQIPDDVFCFVWERRKKRRWRTLVGQVMSGSYFVILTFNEAMQQNFALCLFFVFFRSYV